MAPATIKPYYIVHSDAARNRGVRNKKQCTVLAKPIRNMQTLSYLEGTLCSARWNCPSGGGGLPSGEIAAVPETTQQTCLPVIYASRYPGCKVAISSEGPPLLGQFHSVLINGAVFQLPPS